MRRLSSIIPVVVVGVLVLTGCGSEPGAGGPPPTPTTSAPEAASPATASTEPDTTAEPDDDTEEVAMATVTLDSVSVEIILADNVTVQDLASRSPIELTVTDYGGKEKVGTLPFSPEGRQDLTPTRVNKGEVYLYGSNSLVIFYVSEPNQWGGYTPLGVLRDPDVLDAFIGSGETAVTIDFTE